MKLLFRQRFFSWFDSYDIYDESGATLYSVKGHLSWGHKLHIHNAQGVHIGTVKQAVFTIMPRFDLYENGGYIGCLKKRFTPFRPSYTLDYKGWNVRGNFFEWDYEITNSDGMAVARISKELFRLTDTYVIEVFDPSDALYALMFTLAIDAEKCSRNNH